MIVATKTCRACGRTYTGGEVFCPDDGSRLLAHSRSGDGMLDPLIGNVLDGRYRVRRVIGEGGMGIVYEGVHTLIERPVAIKVLRDDFCKRADAVERFRREAKSASRIGHPNIVDVLDFGETPSGASYFVMEMLQGEDLADVLARGGALAPERAVPIVFQCCQALAAAHDKGIVHRDLKPENIFLVERDGYRDFVKIVDFGVAKMTDLEFDLENTGTGGGGSSRAKLTRTGMIFGTPEYMSPEQAGGLPPDHRVDIYALGVTLYELLTGRVPFEGESFMSVLSKHASKSVPALRDVNPRVKVSPELENVVFHTLRKERKDRFQHMRDMAAALEQTPEMPVLPFRFSAPSGQGAARSSDASGAMAIHARTPSERVDSQLEALIGPSRRHAFAAGIAAVALLVAAGVYAASGRFSSGRAEVVLSGDRVAATQAQAASDVTPVQAVRGSAPADEEATLDLVKVRITTEPDGATVRLSDGMMVCASTPCTFEAVRGAAVTLVAERGAYRAGTSLTPSAATDLHLVLNSGVKPKPKAKGAGTTPVAHDDLKTPAMFQR
jgi:serine/threonine-protein kinase